jgi:hypothetical protein
MKRVLTVCVLAVCVALSLSLALGACEKKGGDIVGTWTDEAGSTHFQFKADGTLLVEYPGNSFAATYTAKDGKLSVRATGPGGAALGAMFRDVEYAVDGDQLSLTNSAGETQTLSRE